MIGARGAGDGVAELSEATALARLRGRLQLMIHDNGSVFSITAFFVVMATVFSLITDTFLTETNLLNRLARRRGPDLWTCGQR